MPLRKITEAANADVDFDSENRIVSIVKDDTEVLVPINENYIMVNGLRVEIDTAAEIDEDERTYMPIRAVMEALGYNVEWDNATKCVYLASLNMDDLHIEGWRTHTYPTYEPTGIDNEYAFVFNGLDRKLTPERAAELAENTVYLYGMSEIGQNVDIALTYEVYKLIDDGEELVYQLPLPSYNGFLSPGSQNVCTFSADFWAAANIEEGDKFRIKYSLSAPEPDSVSYGRTSDIEFVGEVTAEYEIQQGPYRFAGTMFVPSPPFGIMFTSLTYMNGGSRFYATATNSEFSISNDKRLDMEIGLINVRQADGAIVEDLTPFIINVEMLRLEGEPYSDDEIKTSVFSFDIPVYSIYKIPEYGRFNREASWNLKDRNGQLVEPGRYMVRLNLPELIYVRYAGEDEARPVFMGDPNSSEAEEYGGGVHVINSELRFEMIK